MDSPVPAADAQGPSGGGKDGEDEDEEDEDGEALKAHIAKMKAGGDTSAGNGEQLARSVKCSEVGPVFPSSFFFFLRPFLSFFASPILPRSRGSLIKMYMKKANTVSLGSGSAARYSRMPIS